VVGRGRQAAVGGARTRQVDAGPSDASAGSIAARPSSEEHDGDVLQSGQWLGPGQTVSEPRRLLELPDEHAAEHRHGGAREHHPPDARLRDGDRHRAEDHLRRGQGQGDVPGRAETVREAMGDVVPAAAQHRPASAAARDDDQRGVEDDEPGEQRRDDHTARPEVARRDDVHHHSGDQQPDQQAPPVAHEDP
jgi:hypothetical protein